MRDDHDERGIASRVGKEHAPLALLLMQGVSSWDVGG